MKRMAGLLLTTVGMAALVWGVAAILTGSMSARVTITDDVSVSALTGGLLGAATFTLGLLWIRD